MAVNWWQNRRMVSGGSFDEDVPTLFEDKVWGPDSRKKGHLKGCQGWERTQGYDLTLRQ